MKREKLAVEARKITGKEVKKLRHEGILPANVYGKDMKSMSVQMPIKAFLEVFNEVHETGLVDLAVDGQTFPVLIKNLHIDPSTRLVLHADFHKVNLKQKITAKIPVELIGEAKAVVDGVGTLNHPLSEIEVEALPTDLPEKIEVNIEGLEALDQQITVADLKVPSEVTVLTAPDQIICKIDEIKVIEEPVAEEAPAEGEAAEGAEGEAKTETGAETKEQDKETEGKPQEKGAEAKAPQGKTEK